VTESGVIRAEPVALSASRPDSTRVTALRITTLAVVLYCLVAAFGVVVGLHIQPGELGRPPALTGDLFR
jgi:hypothetical protein